MLQTLHNLNWDHIFVNAIQPLWNWFALSLFCLWPLIAGSHVRRTRYATYINSLPETTDKEKIFVHGSLRVVTLKSIAIALTPVLIITALAYGSAGGDIDLKTRTWTDEQLTEKAEAAISVLIKLIIPTVIAFYCGAFASNPFSFLFQKGEEHGKTNAEHH